MKRVHSCVPLFAALADENRLRLLHLMRRGEICVCFLQGTLNTNQPRVSRHLAYLRRAGLVQARRQGKWSYYSLKKQPPSTQRLLANVLAVVAKQPIFQRDLARSRKIQCAPSRFGLNNPDKDSSV